METALKETEGKLVNLPDKKFDSAEFLKNLPHLPGVYRYFDKDGNLLYVGKARDLKRRVSSYFQKTLAPRTKLMVDQIASAQITVVNSEAEALILESNLIKTQDPRFNILFRDDKSYPYLKLSSGEYPRLSYYRGALDKRNSYFGPYPNANAAKDTMLLLQKVFQLRTCETSVFNNRSRPCLLYQIGRCSGGCCKKVSPEEYGKSVDLAKEFLRGDSQKVQEDLTRRMNEYSQKLDFERAAVMRDHLAAISNVIHQQSMEAAPDANADIIAAVAAQGEVCVNLAMVRGGRHLGDKASFPSLGRNAELPELEEVLEAFITHHYTQMDVPPVVIINLDHIRFTGTADHQELKSSSIRLPVRRLVSSTVLRIFAENGLNSLSLMPKSHWDAKLRKRVVRRKESGHWFRNWDWISLSPSMKIFVLSVSILAIVRAKQPKHPA